MNSESSLSAGQFWTATLTAVVCLCLVAFNAMLGLKLQEKRAHAHENQRFVNQSIQLSRFNTELIQALARLAAAEDDQDLADLLASQGISFSVRNKEQDSAPKKEQEGASLGTQP